jgi:hypothetical protein
LLSIQIGGPGGRAEPDIVGARINGQGQLVIRHCEVAAWPAFSAEAIARNYGQKFRPAIIQRVEEHFRRLFGALQGTAITYEKWLIFCISAPAQAAIHGILPDVGFS